VTVLRDLLGHCSVTTTQVYLSQGSGVASGGRETAGRLVSGDSESLSSEAA
jgi:hypothetical protein